MKQIFIVYQKKCYKLIALDSAGMGMLSRKLMENITDPKMMKIAKLHPQNIEIIRLY